MAFWHLTVNGFFYTHLNWSGVFARVTWNGILSRDPSLWLKKGCVKLFERFLHPDAPPALQCQVSQCP